MVKDVVYEMFRLGQKIAYFLSSQAVRYGYFLPNNSYPLTSTLLCHKRLILKIDQNSGG
jgi:hypothetical protein